LTLTEITRAVEPGSAQPRARAAVEPVTPPEGARRARVLGPGLAVVPGLARDLHTRGGVERIPQAMLASIGAAEGRVEALASERVRE